MRIPRSTFPAALLATLAFATAAKAEPDTFGLGSGRSGALAVTTGKVVVNDYAELAAPVAAGARSVVVGSTVGAGKPIAAGDAVMLWQTTGLAAAAAGDGAPVDLSTRPVGLFELARVAGTSGSTVTLTNPLVHAYAAPASQLVRIPEHTTVTIASGAALSALPWDGAKGGIVALLATGALANDGLVEASAAGFRGGSAEDAVASFVGCAALVGFSSAGGGAHKGESLFPAAFSTAAGAGPAAYGYGNVASGGGGGNCHNAGGGGGGNGGAGGAGGQTYVGDGSRSVGGLGGARVVFDPRSRLVLGGGGGAGDGNDGRATPGGRGGGVVWLRSQSMSGGGAIAADGSGGAHVVLVGNGDGAGGGGAGGTVAIGLAGTASCAGVQAAGGAGGNGFDNHGVGGGGGGGVARLDAMGGSCPLAVAAGAPGAANRPTDTVAGGVTGPAPETGPAVSGICDQSNGGCGGCVGAAVPSGCPGGVACDETTHRCAAPPSPPEPPVPPVPRAPPAPPARPAPADAAAPVTAEPLDGARLGGGGLGCATTDPDRGARRGLLGVVLVTVAALALLRRRRSRRRP